MCIDFDRHHSDGSSFDLYIIFLLCYKMWAISTGISSTLEKKNQVKSLSIWSRVPKLGSDPPIGSDRESGCDTHPEPRLCVLRLGRPCRGRVMGLVTAFGRPCRKLGWPCRRPSTGLVTLPVPCHACLAIQPSGQATRCIATHKAAPPAAIRNFVSRQSPWPGHARALSHALHVG